MHVNLRLVLSKRQAPLCLGLRGTLLKSSPASLTHSLTHSLIHPHGSTGALGGGAPLPTARALWPQDAGQAQTLSSCDEPHRLSWAQQPYLSQSLGPDPQPQKRNVRATGGPSRLQQVRGLWPQIACPVGAGLWVRKGQEGISPEG